MLKQLVGDCETQLDEATESAHKHPVPFEFDGSREFTKEQLTSVWVQGRFPSCSTQSLCALRVCVGQRCLDYVPAHVPL
mgnify:CR=1 FL=1